MTLRKKRKAQAPEVDQPAGPVGKRIDIQSGKFEANGRTYYIQMDTLKLARYVAYMQLQQKLAFGTDFQGLYNTLTKIWNAASSGNDILKALADIRELSYNQLNAVVDFVGREHPEILRFCALFINAEDEDIGKWDERIVDQKITDWIEEGLDIQDFFSLAAGYSPGFLSAFEEQLKHRGVDVERIRKASETLTNTPTTAEHGQENTPDT